MPRFPDSLNLINGQVYDPRTRQMARQNVALHQGMIIGLGMLPDDKDEEFEVLDVEGKVILPYIIDLRQQIPSQLFSPDSLAECLKASESQIPLIAVVETAQQAELIRAAKQTQNLRFFAAIMPQTLFNAASQNWAKSLLQEGLIDAFISDENTPSEEVFVAAALTAGCSVGGLSREALFDLVTWRPKQIVGSKQKGLCLTERPSLRVISFDEGPSPEPYLDRKLQGWTVIALEQGKIAYRKMPSA